MPSMTEVSSTAAKVAPVNNPEEGDVDELDRKYIENSNNSNKKKIAAEEVKNVVS